MRTHVLAQGNLYATVMLAFLAAATAKAVPVYWTDSGTDDWTDGTNWTSNPNPPQPADLAYVGLGGTAQLAAATTVTDMRVGHGSTNLGNGTVELNAGADLNLTHVYVKLDTGYTGTINHNDGTHDIGGNLNVGYATGAGEGFYNLSGGSLNFSSPTATLDMAYEGTFNWSGGAITGVHDVKVGSGAGNFKSVFNLGGNTLMTSGLLQVGFGGGSQADEFNFQGGTVDTNEYFMVAGSTAPGGTVVDLDPGDTLTTGTVLYVGYAANALGVFNQNGGDLDIGTDLVIAQAANSEGTFNLNAGDVTFSGGDLNIEQTGTFNWNSGTITNVNDVRIGTVAGDYKAVFNLGGHTLTTTGTVEVGRGGGSQADEFNFQGGEVDAGAYFLLGGSTAPGGTVVDLDPGETLTTGTTLYVGYVAGGLGVFNQNGGTLEIGLDMRIAEAANSQGTFNLNAGDVEFTNGTISSRDLNIIQTGTFNWNSGTITGVDDVQIGTVAGDYKSVFNLGGHTLTTTGLVHVGRGGGSQADEFNFQGGEVNAGAYFMVGGSTAPGGTVVNLNAGDTLTTTSHLYVGYVAGALGVFSQNGGSLTIGDDLLVSDLTNSQGLYRLNSGTALFTGGTSDIILDGTSDVEVNGGSLSGANNLLIGVVGAGTATYTQNGGTVTIDSFVRVADNAGDEDFFNLGGGTFNVPASADFVMENDSTANISGGTLNLGRDMLVGTIASQLATVNQSGGVVNIANDLSLATVASANGDYNLTGGVLNVTGAVDLEAPGTKTFTLDGGTLAATTIDDTVGGGVFDWQSGTLTPGPLGTAATLIYNGSSLVASSDSIFHFDLAAAGLAGGPNDLLFVSGDLTLDGSVTIDALSGFPGIGTFPIIQVDGTLTNLGLNVPNENYSIEIVDFGSFTQVNLVLVPEPSSLMLGIGALGLAAVVRRRRRGARRVHAMHPLTNR